MVRAHLALPHPFGVLERAVGAGPRGAAIRVPLHRRNYRKRGTSNEARLGPTGFLSPNLLAYYAGISSLRVLDDIHFASNQEVQAVACTQFYAGA